MLYFEVEADWNNFNRLQDEIKKLKESLKDIGINADVAAEMSRRLEQMQSEFNALVQKASLAGDAFIRDFTAKVISSSDELERHGVIIDKTAEKLVKLSEAESKASTGQSKETTNVKFDENRYKLITESTAKAADAMEENVTKALGSLIQLVNGLDDEAEATKAEIERLEEALGDYEKAAENAAAKGDSMGEEVFNLQIGNVKQGLEDAKQNLEVIEQLKEAVREQTSALGDNMKQAIMSADEFSKLHDEIEKVSAQMRDLEAAGKSNTAEYAELQKRLDSLAVSYEQAADNVNKFNQDIKEVPSARAEFEEFSDEVKEGADAVSKLTGNNEEMVGILKKVKAVMAETTKLQGVANTQNRNNAAGNAAKQQGLLANALTLVNSRLASSVVGMRTATTVARTLTAALSTGPLIIVTAILAVLAKLVSMWKKSREEQAKFYKDTANAAAKPIAAYKKMQTEWNALNFSEKEQYIKKNAKAFDELGMSINSVADAERLLVEMDEKFIELQMQKAKAATLEKMAEEKTGEWAEKNIEQSTRKEKEQWGDAEHAVKVLEKRLAASTAMGPSGWFNAVRFAKQLKEARDAMAKGEEYWLAEDEWVNKRLDKQQTKLQENVKERNAAAKKAKDAADAAAKELGIDTGEVEADSIAFYKQKIATLNKQLEKDTDTTGKTAAEIRKKIQGYQNQIDEINGTAAQRREKYYDDAEKAELNNQRRIIAIQQKGVQQQLSLIDVEYKQKKAERDRQERDLAKQLSEGKLTNEEFLERSEQIDKEWLITQKEMQKKRADIYKAEAERRVQMQDEIDNITLQGQKRNLQLQEDGIEKQLALIDLEYEEKIKEYEKQERELQKQLEDKKITQEEYDKKSTLIGYQKEYLAGWETDKQKKDIIDSLVSGYKDYTDKKLEIDEQYAKKRAELEAVINNESATEEQKALAQKGLVKLEQDRNKAQVDLGMEELKQGGEWQMVFENLNNYGQTTLNNLKKKLDEIGDSVTENMNPADLTAYNEALQRLNERLMDFNPRVSYKNAKQTLEEKRKAATQAKTAYEAAEGIEAQKKAMQDLIKAEDEAAKAEENFNIAQEKMLSHVDKMTAPLKKLASQLEELGGQSETLAGDIAAAVGSVVNTTFDCIDQIVDITKAASDAMQAASKGAEGASKVTAAAISTVEKASVILAIISAVLQIGQKIEQMIDKNKQRNEDKIDDINRLQGAVNDYRSAVLEAQLAEKNWFAQSRQGGLADSWKRSQQALENYNKAAYKVVDEYKDEEGGGLMVQIGKWATKGMSAVGDAIGAGLKEVGMGWADNALEYVDLGRLSAKAFGAANDEGWDWGETHQNVYQAAKELKQGEKYAKDNLRMITQHKEKGTLGIGSKKEKTQDLEEWTKENLGADLYNKATGRLDIDVAQTILNNYSEDLPKTTKITLEELKKQEEGIEQFEEDVKTFVSDTFSGMADTLVDSLFNWLDTGESVLDAFEAASKETFRNIAKDTLKQQLLEKYFDNYADELAKVTEQGARGEISPEEAARKYKEIQDKLNSAVARDEAQLKGMAQAIDTAFGGTTADQGQQSAVAGAYKTMSEDTAGVLEARFTAVYESNLAIHGAITNAASELINQQKVLYNVADDARNILVQSNLELQAIRTAADNIEKHCIVLMDYAYNTQQNTKKMAG